MRTAEPINIVGAGLAGALLGLMLARRDRSVTLFDRRPDPRSTSMQGGRSINLALAARGIKALEHAGVMERVRPLLIRMRGRMIHDAHGKTALHPYGQRDTEVIYSVGRAALNRVLIEAAAEHPRVKLVFGQTCVGVDLAADELQLRDETGRQLVQRLAPTIAADGAGSAVRQNLAAAGVLKSREEWLQHDYKELAVPAVGGRPALHADALHVWPRGGFMLIALPNTDATFTATLFLARDQFRALSQPDAVIDFFQREFPDVVTLIPDLTAQFEQHPAGQLGTVYASPWHSGGQVVLLGDAAHAIVPFHGQGMNAAFEDCLVFDSLLDSHADWADVFGEFERLRVPNTHAIARMALENYVEMRDTVLDPGFVRRKALALELERRHPDRFIPRYSMVMFHPEIPYAEALRRGEVQADLLLELDSRSPVDFAYADRLISERLSALAPA
jgi:kynurenine 3-monooxygenase